MNFHSLLHNSHQDQVFLVLDIQASAVVAQWSLECHER